MNGVAQRANVLPSTCDVLVVGARCAGATVAYHLARAGCRVVVIERAPVLGPVPSTHFVWADGVRALHALGLRDAIVASGAPYVTELVGSIDGVELRADLTMGGAQPGGVCVRRGVLDPMLVRAAAAAGARFHFGSTFVAPVVEHGAVVGARYSGPDGGGVIRSTLLVGADGRRSRVAATLSPWRYNEFQADTFTYWRYYRLLSGPAATGTLRFWQTGTRRLLVVEADGGHLLAALSVKSSQRSTTSLPTLFDRSLEDAPRDLSLLVRSCLPVPGEHVMRPTPTFWRAAAGPGWALVGDAGYYRDPCTGRGIADAVSQASLLATAAVELLGGDSKALRSWWVDRDRAHAVWGGFAHRQMVGNYGPFFRALLREVAKNRHRADALSALSAQDVHPARVFTPRLVMRAAAASLVARESRPGTVVREVADLVATEIRCRAVARIVVRRAAWRLAKSRVVPATSGIA